MTIDLALASSSSRGRGGVQPGSPCAALPPGFRFHPTDEELIVHYLRRRAAAAPCPAPVIAEVDIYKLDPWDLPAKAVFGEAEWYFFSPRDRKYPNGVRPNRAAGSGYWKATGTDKPITLSGSTAAGASSASRDMIGVKKALVFYTGRPPKGTKTSWIMHEYRLAEAIAAAHTYRPARFKDSSISMRLDDWVLCRIYKKASPQLYSSPTHDAEAELSMDDGGLGLGHIAYGQHHQQQQDHSVDDDPYATAGGRLPRPTSISDFLADFSAVSELFESMPTPELIGATSDAAGSSGAAAAAAARPFLVTSSDASSSVARQSSHKRPFMEDFLSTDAETTQQLHAPSKRSATSDGYASRAVNTYAAFGFGPGQPSHSQDRI